MASIMGWILVFATLLWKRILVRAPTSENNLNAILYEFHKTESFFLKHPKVVLDLDLVSGKATGEHWTHRHVFWDMVYAYDRYSNNAHCSWNVGQVSQFLKYSNQSICYQQPCHNNTLSSFWYLMQTLTELKVLTCTCIIYFFCALLS